MNITAEELVDLVSMLTWRDGVQTWKITEEFNKKKEYTLDGLELEIEKGIVIATDENDEIYSDCKSLMGFLVTSIQDIIHKSKAEFIIKLRFGTITIRGIIK